MMRASVCLLVVLAASWACPEDAPQADNKRPLLGVARAGQGPPPQSATDTAADFLPQGYATDGSVSYQREIQRAIDVAARDGRPLVFPAMAYRLDESGLQLRSRSTFSAGGSYLNLPEEDTSGG